MKGRVFCAVLGVLSVGVLPPETFAQAKGAKQEVRNQYDIGGMIDQAVRNISMRYNLNEEQHQITQQMMEEGVNRFLLEHADQIYPLIRDLTRAEMSGRNLSVSQRMRVGKLGQPLVELAKAEILKHNKEWHHILSEEQKVLHEWDVQEMDDQFGEIRGKFETMAEGKPVDNPIFPEQPTKSNEPPRPKKPKAMPDTKQRSTRVSGEADVFDNYVQKFIKDYALDAGQRETALSILREYKGYADVYRKVKKDAYAKVDKQAEEARKAGDFAKLKETEKQRDKLNERIVQLLGDMKERLKTIPRESQKRAHAKGDTAKSGEASGKDDKSTPAKADKKSDSKPDTKAAKPKDASPGPAKEKTPPKSKESSKGKT